MRILAASVPVIIPWRACAARDTVIILGLEGVCLLVRLGAQSEVVAIALVHR